VPGDYSLVVTDANGCSISKTVTLQNTNGISETSGAGTVIVYPNPAMNEIVLKFELKNCKSNELFIEDISGHTLFSAKLSGQENSLIIDTSLFKSGIYLLRLRNTCGQTIKKLLKL
jgi:hypothetical protein